MNRPQSASEIDDEAAAWAVRLDAGEGAAPELKAWLAGDPRRSGALLRAQAALDLAGRSLAVYGAGAAFSTAQPLRPNRRWLIAGGGGAIAAGFAGAGLWLAQSRSFETQRGEIRRAPLPDGSLIVINTQSALNVSMRPRLRHIQLRRGEAWFDVAKDLERPFVVAVADVRVRAVGTAFSVRQRTDGAEIMVTEGVVEAWRKGRPERARIEAGCVFTSDGSGGAPVAAPERIERTLAWRAGQLVLDGDRLADAAAQFNRYNARQIVISDAAVANEKFVGVFQLNEPESFARAAAAALGADVDADQHTIRLGRLAQK